MNDGMLKLNDTKNRFWRWWCETGKGCADGL
jgi:hypothetical protein